MSAQIDALTAKVHSLERELRTLKAVQSDYVDSTHAKKLLGVSTTKLWELVQAGAIQTSKIGRQRLYALADLEAIQADPRAAKLAVHRLKARRP